MAKEGHKYNLPVNHNSTSVDIFSLFKMKCIKSSKGGLHTISTLNEKGNVNGFLDSVSYVNTFLYTYIYDTLSTTTVWKFSYSFKYPNCHYSLELLFSLSFGTSTEFSFLRTTILICIMNTSVTSHPYHSSLPTILK